MKFSNLQKSPSKEVDLPAFAFFQGSQGVPLEQARHEITAIHDKERARTAEESVRREKLIEATIQKLKLVLPQVDAAWDDLVRRLGQQPPAYAAAILIAALGIGALVIDAILTGPGLDIVGISDQIVQWIAAFGLAALSSAIFHFAFESFEQNRLSIEIKVIRIGLACLAVLALLGWGVLRGSAVKFGADLSQNPLGGFLGGHPVLSSIFFCFVTLGAPLVGAAAIHHAAPRIHDGLTWKKAKHAHDTAHAALGDAEKNLEAERITLKHQLLQLDAQQANWQALAAQYHERGRIRGARQTPHWLVLLKATAWSPAGLVLGYLGGLVFPPLYAVVPAGAWVAAFLYYRHRRFHPTYTQFIGQENTHFAVSTDRPIAAPLVTPKLLPPPEDKQ